MKEIPCPKKYYAFDLSSIDCEYCHKAKLYQPCRICDKTLACAGWADKDVYCCSCYKMRELRID